MRFSHCDPAGIVYTPRFVDMMNGAIEDFFPGALGLDYHHILRDLRYGLGYASVACDFFMVASMGDTLTFTTLVEHVGGTSARLIVHIHRGDAEVCRGAFVMVPTNMADNRPIRFEALRQAMIAYQESCR